MRRLTHGLWSVLAVEQDRYFLWLPVLFGGGIAIYFNLPVEPPLWPLALLACAGLAIGRIWRTGLASLIVAGLLGAPALGLLAAKAASDFFGAPMLVHEVRHATITGWVALSEPRVGGAERITIRVAAIEGMAPDRTPESVRVRVPGARQQFLPGTPVRISASLLPPSGPAIPGAYDFARTAWFQGLGAVGYSRQRPEIVPIEAPMPVRIRWWVPVEQVRQAIGRRIVAGLPGESGAIANALITGERGSITDATNNAYRDSGLFHILSISGLHMTVFAGAVYVAARAVLALIPGLALAFEIKKWAAVTGILGTAGYLMISGYSPPAVRSALMISVMFVAMLLDRPALALRNVALAALVILVLTPSSLIDVGFQMSFAAVVSLISAFEAWRVWRNGNGAEIERERPGPLGGTLQFIGSVTATTLIATASVAPFAAYYFHKSQQYGVVANLIAIPICNMVVMPAALAVLAAMPLGLEAWPLVIMGLGIDAMSWIAYRVAALPGAVALVPAIPTLSFGLMVAGGLWLAIWGQRWRLLGFLPIAVGLAVSPLRRTPDVLVSGSGALVAVRASNGRLAALDTARSAFELGRWLEHDADARPAATVGRGKTIACDANGCVARVNGVIVAIPRRAGALGEDCRTARVVIWLGAGRAECPVNGAQHAHSIDRLQLDRDGTHALRITPDALEVETVGAWRGRRPWATSGAGRTNPGGP